MSDALEKLQLELSPRNACWSRLKRAVLHDAEHQNPSAKELEDAHKQIEQVHHKLIAALDVVNGPVFLHDKEWRILRCNKV